MDAEKEQFEIVVLCREELHALYEQHLDKLDPASGSETALTFVETTHEFVSKCLVRPPDIALVDISTLIRGSTPEMNALFELPVRWPVLRAKLDSKSLGFLMSTSPPRREPMREAIREILRGGESVWSRPHKTQTRASLRIRTDCRGRVRECGATEWNLGNLLDLGIGGARMISYHPYTPGTSVEFELTDQSDCPLVLEAKVAWCHRWEDSRALPSIGLAFESDEHLVAIRELLSTLNIRCFFA